jgi:hypothetical protein
MSTWHVRAIERLGTPLPSWPTIWGPADPGADPIVANGLRTVDLTPNLKPLQDLTANLERDLTKASFGSVNLDLRDDDEALAVRLGPASDTLATHDRYYGPWVEIIEAWGATSAVRWTGYLDETSLQWDEAAATTRATVLHASQLLRERRLADLPELLRPYPAVPTTAGQSFAQSTADALLDADVPAYVPRADAVALEAALWAAGQFSWTVATSQEVERTWFGTRTFTHTTALPPPAPPANSLTIGGTGYAVDRVEWDETLAATVTTGTPDDHTITATRRVARIYLQGAPDLTGPLTLGATVTWGIAEALRTHYVLAEDVPAPVSGSDGQRWLKLTTLEQLVAGDTLTITFVDTSSGTQRRASLETTVIDLDGQTSKVWLKDPIAQALLTTSVLKIRRNSRDPVLFDGLAYAHQVAAPWTLDTTHFTPAATSRPILTWLPLDAANPNLYAVHAMAGLDRAGALRLARRGPFRASDSTYPLTGVWEGSWAAGWAWLGAPTASAVLEVLGDLNQWPGGANTARPPVLYLNGDLSGGATIPPNGWRGYYRTWKSPESLSQDAESTWDGVAITWNGTAPTGLIPTRLVAFAAQTASPGRYIRTNVPAWTFEPHTGPGTLGAAVTPAITGVPPSGSWIALGMGIYAPAASDEQEALLGLVATGVSEPFTDVTAALFSQASGGDLTLRQSLSLWSSGGVPHGAWALGGGLVVQTTTETQDGVTYPKTILHKLDGANHLTVTLRTLEVIPQSLQPLGLTGPAGAQTVSGWYALAIETYLDESFAATRRLRFLWLSASLTLLNGELEADPADPTNPAATFRRGDPVSSILAEGALPARLLRTGQGDRMVGFVGGRLFQVDTTLPTTIERLKVGAAATRGQDTSGLSAADFLEQFAQVQLASVIPDATGHLRLVSRAGGALQVRTLGGSQVSVRASERSARRTLQTYRGYVSEVRVTYTDGLTGDGRQVVVVSPHAGGKPLSLDLSNLVSGPAMAAAIGEANAFWFGEPAVVLTETWADLTPSVQGDAAPAWWADWNMGDLVTFTAHVAPQLVDAYKIHVFKPGPESREVQVELLKLPTQVPGV